MKYRIALDWCGMPSSNEPTLQPIQSSPTSLISLFGRPSSLKMALELKKTFYTRIGACSISMSTTRSSKPPKTSSTTATSSRQPKVTPRSITATESVFPSPTGFRIYTNIVTTCKSSSSNLVPTHSAKMARDFSGHPNLSTTSTGRVKRCQYLKPPCDVFLNLIDVFDPRKR